MSEQINWHKLYIEGRCKAQAVPWTQEELEARGNGFSAEEVRAGILTEKDRGTKVVKTRADYIKEVKALGIPFDERVIAESDLIKMIEHDKEKKAKEAQAKANAKADKEARAKETKAKKATKKTSE